MIDAKVGCDFINTKKALVSEGGGDEK